MKSLSVIIVSLFLVLFINQQTIGRTRDTIREQKYESQLAAINPSLVRIFKDATVALDQGNLTKADSLYSMVCLKAPKFDVGLRRLGGVKLSEGNFKEALKLSNQAVSINRSAYNLLSLALCYMDAPPDQNGNYLGLNEATKLLKEGQTLPGGDDVEFNAILAQIALKNNNMVDFRTYTNVLMTSYKNEMVSHYYAAILATVDEDWSKAKDEILIAKDLGLDDQTVQDFLDSGIASKVHKRSLIHYFIYIVLAWIAGLFLLFIIGKILSNITMRSLERLDQNQDHSGGLLRSFYRKLINIGGVYYYVSLPIIVVLVIGLVAALFYFFIMIGQIPIKLMLILGIGAIVTVFGMIRSLLVKVNYADPGRELKAEEAPRLFELTKEVASAIGTRPIDEIRITHLTDLAVYEKGSWRTKLKDRAKRILILGVGVLKDFRQNDFKAVLAHEYGHFSHRDTAGGEVALRVRNDMTKYVIALYKAGQAVWWNLAFQFLRLYDFIFRRISHGATRLQEVMADRVAAQTYGIQAFKNGLTYVIRREIEFTNFANKEIEEAQKTKRGFSNLYELSGSLNPDMEKEFTNAMSRKTTEDDTHPSPVDRFKYISGIDAPSMPESSSYVRDLFTNWDSLTKEMTNLIEVSIKKQRN